LLEGTDFTVTYTNNTAVGLATVTFKGAGTRFNNGTEKPQTFNITAKPVTINAKVEPATVGYGAEYTPSVTWGDGVTDADKTALGDITYSYKEKTSSDPATATKPTAVGEYYVYADFATPNANYTPTINVGEFAITNGDLQAKVSVADVTYGETPTFSIVPFTDGASFPDGSNVNAAVTEDSPTDASGRIISEGTSDTLDQATVTQSTESVRNNMLNDIENRAYQNINNRFDDLFDKMVLGK
jgi:hypothetical protein